MSLFRFQDVGLPAHTETVIYLIRVLRLVEAGEKPDSIRLDEWDAHKALLANCRNFDAASAFMMKKTPMRPHSTDIQFWDEFIRALKDGNMPNALTIEQARKHHLQDIDLCRDKKVFY